MGENVCLCSLFSLGSSECFSKWRLIRKFCTVSLSDTCDLRSASSARDLLRAATFLASSVRCFVSWSAAVSFWSSSSFSCYYFSIWINLSLTSIFCLFLFLFHIWGFFRLQKVWRCLGCFCVSYTYPNWKRWFTTYSIVWK